MEKFAIILFLSSGLFVSFQQAYSSDCRVEGTAYIPGLDPNAATGDWLPDPSSYDNTEILDFPGAGLPGQLGGPSGSNRLFSGPVTPGAILYGPYRDYVGVSTLEISSYIEFSTNWQPDGREVCVNHKTKLNGARICVEKGMEYEPTSFIVDITQNKDGALGTPIYQKTFSNVNQFSRGHIYLPNLHCTGDMSALEIRLHSLTGGSVDFTIHNVHLDSRWKYAQ